MIQAILLDLDDTLLENDMDRFVPAYLEALGQHMAEFFPPEELISHLLQATDAMVQDTDPARTNREAFNAAFFPALGRSREELEPHFDAFYATQFSELRHVTRVRPQARNVVEWAFEKELQVVIATNPLFPRIAVEQRLEWAAVPTSQFPYHLVTSYENMHATKPHPAYYREIAQRLSRQAEECLMVGDNWDADIRPALSVGMEAYWIADAHAQAPDGDFAPVAQGSLSDFDRWIRGRTDEPSARQM